MNNERQNLLTLAIVCMAVLLVGDYLIRQWFPSALPPEAGQQESAVLQTPSSNTQEESRLWPLNEALSRVTRVAIETPAISGSINVTDGVVDDIVLKGYRQTPQKNSPPIRLLSPAGTRQAYYVDVGLSDAASIPVRKTWQVSGGSKLTPDSSVMLTWESPQGVLYKRCFSVDQAGMFFVTCSVHNQSAQPIDVNLYGAIHRREPELQSQMWSHEGPIAFLNGSLTEIAYKDLPAKEMSGTTTRGWLGITDKYWLTAFAPYEDMRPKITGDDDRALVSFQQDRVRLDPGQTQKMRTRFFVGAKVLDVLDSYEVSQKIQHFDLALDFGWFYFITKPTFYVLSWLKSWAGSFGAAILLFTVLLKLLFFPLANRAYRSMNRMKILTPELEKMKVRYKDDPQRMSQEVMALYRREKVNPVSGCLPMLLQIPFFFALYKVLSISIEMRHAPFWGWISDLSAPDPTNLFTLFGLLPISLPGFLHLGLWPILMGASMFLQQRLSPPPADPVQRVMFMYVMPIVFTLMFGNLAAGVVIYWTWNNLLSVGQQWLVTRMASKEV